MDGPTAEARIGVDRRSFLAATVAGITGATSGCIREARSAINREQLSQLSVSITSLPADGDRQAIQLARRIAENLEAVGIDVSIPLRSHEEFRRDILVNHDYDMYVGLHPGSTDPDFLHEALHSRYTEEPGWQNPFGFTNLLMDELLERQRDRDGEDRQAAVEELLEAVALEQPFVPICRPEEVRLVRTDRFDGWEAGALASRLGYLSIEPVQDDELLRGIVIDARPSENINPLSVEYRHRGLFVELLYDSLATEDDGELIPWLAESWEWTDGELEVTLREGHAFHDGEPVTAHDVAFTYRFLEDTSLGRSDVPSPSPHYRGLASPVERIEVHDDHALTLAVDAGEAVGERALTVPVLPEHVWEPRSAEADVRGVQIAKGTTEAVVTDNVPAIGSGPFRFGSRTEREHLTLERFDDHFTTRGDVDLPEATVETFRAQIDPRSASAISLIRGDDADVTVSMLEAYVLDGLEETDDTRLLRSGSQTFYHLGFNVRNDPFANPYFRRAIARVIDKAWLIEDVFDGYAEPIAAPVIDEWVPDSLVFEDEDPEVPFHGSDGDLDVSAARSTFEDAGYRFDGGDLVVRD